MYYKQLEDDLRAQVSQVGATIVVDQDDAKNSWSDVRTRELHIGEISSPLSYFIALHELGHIVTTHDRLTRTNTINIEATATEWAKEHSIVPWKKVERDALEALWSYFVTGDYVPDDNNNDQFHKLIDAEPQTIIHKFRKMNNKAKSMSDDEYKFFQMMERVQRMDMPNQGY